MDSRVVFKYRLMNRQSAGILLLTLAGCSLAPLRLPDLAHTPSPAASTMAATSLSDEKLIRTEPTNKQAAAACIETARKLQSQGHAREAIVLFERARELAPKDRTIARFLAVLYDQEGHDGRAVAEYNKAIEATPRDPDLLNDWGYYHYRRKDLKEAERIFHEAVSIAANHERACVNLGLVLGEQARYDEAFEAFARVLGPAAAHSNVGVILAGHGSIERARSEFRLALAIQPDLKQSQSFLAYLDSTESEKLQLASDSKRKVSL